MYLFHDAILSIFPEFYNHAYVITKKEDMCKLFNSIFSHKYNNSIEFNTGKTNSSINSIIKLENNDFLMGIQQMNIHKIWGLLTDDVYDDILLLELDKSLPYIINDKEHYEVAVIENDIIPCNTIESGYIRYKDKISKVSDLDIQLRCIGNNYRIIAIAPFHSCTIIEKNDKFLEELQKIEVLSSKDIYELKEKIHRNRTYDVYTRL